MAHRTENGRRTVAELAAATALAATAYHVAAFALLHLLAPSVGIVNGIITDYLNTPYRALAVSTFPAFAMIWFGIAVGLWHTLPGQKPLTIVGSALMGFAGASLVAVTFAPAVADPRNVEVQGSIAALAARSGRMALFLSLLMLSVAVRKARRWGGAGDLLLLLSSLCLAMLLVTMVVLLPRGLAGIPQRAIFLMLYAWVGTATLRVIGR